MSTKKHTIYVINTSDNGKSYWNRGRLREQGRELHVQARCLPSDEVPASRGKAPREGGRRRVSADRSNQGALPWLSARARYGSVFTCDPGFDRIVAMDLVEWVEEAESLLRSDGLWPERNEERARGVLEYAALEGPESLARAMRALRRELQERNRDVGDQSVTSRWLASGRC